MRDELVGMNFDEGDDRLAPGKGPSPPPPGSIPAIIKEALGALTGDESAAFARDIAKPGRARALATVFARVTALKTWGGLTGSTKKAALRLLAVRVGTRTGTAQRLADLLGLKQFSLLSTSEQTTVLDVWEQSYRSGMKALTRLVAKVEVDLAGDKVKSGLFDVDSDGNTLLDNLGGLARGKLDPGLKGGERVRRRLVSGLLGDVAAPDSMLVAGDATDTSRAGALAHKLATDKPADYARLVRGMFTEGKASLEAGEGTESKSFELKRKKDAVPKVKMPGGTTVTSTAVRGALRDHTEAPQLATSDKPAAEAAFVKLVAAGKHKEAADKICTDHGFTGRPFTIVVRSDFQHIAAVGGDIGQGKQQTMKLRTDLFSKGYAFVVRVIAHEFTHVGQRSGADHERVDQPAEREVQAYYYMLQEAPGPDPPLPVQAYMAKLGLRYHAKLDSDKQRVYGFEQAVFQAIIDMSSNSVKGKR